MSDSKLVKDRMLNASPIQDEKVEALIMAQVPVAELITDIIEAEQTLLFLPYADEGHIDRWEKSLSLKAVSNDLEERRRYLITMIGSKLKVSTDTLAELSQSFTGVQSLVSVEGSNVKVRFLGELPKVSLNRFTNYLKAVIPAHLNVGINVEAPMQAPIYLYASIPFHESVLRFN